MAATVALAGGLFVFALVVMAVLAGWETVVDQLRPRLSFWFAVAFAAELVAFVGYVFAYRSVAHIEDGPRIGWEQAASVVAVGFGAFLAKGGGALDSKVLRGRGTKHDGDVRVLALDALEHAPLAPAACAAAIALLVEGERKPGLDFSIPWATLVPIGAVAAFVGVRHRDRFVGKGGWRGQLGQALEGIHLLFRLAAELRVHWPAFLGASVYWAGDVACLWASLKPFGATPTLPAIVLAHAVGYVLTRRTLPFAGAGIVEVLMPLTLVAAGAPFAGAVLGVIVYRFFNLWLPLIPAVAALPLVRRSFRLEPGFTSAQP
jgi:uncharacterized membrane protein YbhN (UPF0104 family)